MKIMQRSALAKPAHFAIETDQTNGFAPSAGVYPS